MTGLATEFREFQIIPGGAFGTIAESATGAPVNAPVLVTVRRGDAGDLVQGHYLGRLMWMPCDSREVEVRA